MSGQLSRAKCKEGKVQDEVGREGRKGSQDCEGLLLFSSSGFLSRSFRSLDLAQPGTEIALYFPPPAPHPTLHRIPLTRSLYTCRIQLLLLLTPYLSYSVSSSSHAFLAFYLSLLPRTPARGDFF